MQLQSLLFCVVFMDVIPVKLKCRYIILSVTGGGIISCCNVFMGYYDSFRCPSYLIYYMILFDLLLDKC